MENYPLFLYSELVKINKDLFQTMDQALALRPQFIYFNFQARDQVSIQFLARNVLKMFIYYIKCVQSSQLTISKIRISGLLLFQFFGLTTRCQLPMARLIRIWVVGLFKGKRSLSEISLFSGSNSRSLINVTWFLNKNNCKFRHYTTFLKIYH